MACDSCGARRGHLPGCPATDTGGRHRKPAICGHAWTTEKGPHTDHKCGQKTGHRGAHLCATWNCAERTP